MGGSALRWWGFALGLVVVGLTMLSVGFTLVLPRGKVHTQRLSIFVTRAVRVVLLLPARLGGSYERADAVLGMMGPIALLAQLATWMTLFACGFALLLWPFEPAFGRALRDAGAALLSLGLVGAEEPGNSLVLMLAAVTGIVTITLHIAYLPALYSSFNRRESLVTQLEARAGAPAWGPELLARHQMVDITDALSDLYAQWEQWAAELCETHTNYPVLLTFRSPMPWNSWLLSLLAVCDAAALHLALCPDAAPSKARLCVRMGFTALRGIATSLGWSYEADPEPEDPIELTFEEFAAAVAMLDSVGFPSERSAEEAWPHFRGWRVNYESLSYRLAQRLVVPPAPWSGPRTLLPESEEVPPQRPPHRSPDGSAMGEDEMRDRLRRAVPADAQERSSSTPRPAR